MAAQVSVWQLYFMNFIIQYVSTTDLQVDVIIVIIDKH